MLRYAHLAPEKLSSVATRIEQQLGRRSRRGSMGRQTART
jgi:hypothetical protein